jgi:gluconolactonase
MKKLLLAVFLACWMACAGCHFPTTPAALARPDSAVGKIELYDTGAGRFIDSNAVIEVIGRHYLWSEGPVWVPAKQMLLFSAVRENKIYQWNGKDTPVVYLTPSGYTDTALRDGENGSNGLALDKEGRLLLCQSGNRQVARLNASLDSTFGRRRPGDAKPVFTVLAPNFKGKKFNSPNDRSTKMIPPGN